MFTMARSPYADRAEELLQVIGKNPSWLARQLGVAKQKVYNWFDGQSPRDENQWARIISLLENEAIIMKSQTGPTAPVDTTEKQPPNLAKSPETQLGIRGMRRIPVLATITAGEPWAQSADVDYEVVPDWGEWFERWGRTVEGDSMHPVFRQGDIAIFENRQYNPGHVVHAFDSGEDTLKCYRIVDGSPILCPFNTEYQSISADGWNVKGVCVARIRYDDFRNPSYKEFRGGLTWAMRDMKE